MATNRFHRDSRPQAAKAPTARFWRWRRNPLRRRSDRVEAWTVLAAGVLLAAAAPAVGVAAGAGVESAALAQSRGWHRTSAVLTQEAPATSGSVYADSAGYPVRATVRWTATDGSTRTGKALVQPGSQAGTRTVIWLDRHGALKDKPATHSEAVAQGVVLGSLAATGTGLLVLGGLWTVRFRLDAARDTEWEREWAAIDPHWGTRRS